jgi:paraquat-inducible protein A
MAATDALMPCDTCGLTQRVEALEPGSVAECIRCGSVIRARSWAGLEVPAALALAALVLYVPANIYPILSMNLYGNYSESTVWDGVVSLMQYDQYFVAVVVFLASIVIPLLKLLGLFFLVITRIYRFIDAIGPWAMLDVFLVAILVALMKLGDLAQVIPGPGLIAFACVVVLTVLASQAFDPKIIWEKA